MQFHSVFLALFLILPFSALAAPAPSGSIIRRHPQAARRPPFGPGRPGPGRPGPGRPGPGRPGPGRPGPGRPGPGRPGPGRPGPPAPPTTTGTTPSPTVSACIAPSPQPAGAEELGEEPTGTLAGIFDGVGTQNYQCDPADPAVAPTAIGANATLTSDTCGSGRHFFVDPTTPDFDMTDSTMNLGNNICEKLGSIPSPDGEENVGWLRLGVTESDGGVTSVYRFRTEGGVAPASCTGDEPDGVVRVDYKAQYWFYVG